MTLRDRRVQYEGRELRRTDLADDPVVQWHRWYDEAAAAGLSEPNAFTLATVDAELGTDARVVLARSVDDRGIALYTNLDSAKGRQLAANPTASGVFAWLDLHRQVRVRGRCGGVTTLRRRRRAATGSLGWMVARGDAVGVLAGSTEPTP